MRTYWLVYNDMILFILSFVAGVLTILAPCILPVLPVIVGGSLGGGSVNIRRAGTVVGALAVSVILFTFLLKVSTALITIPPNVWSLISGGIIFLFGSILLFPELWERLPFLPRVAISANRAVGAGYQRQSLWGDILIGAALGPVFSTCSPTYFFILATVLPVNIALGTLYILAYTAGLAIPLLAIAFLGQRLADRLGILAAPRGAFKRGLGVIFIIVGITISMGLDKQLQIRILDAGFFDVTRVEQWLLRYTGEIEV